MNTHIFIISWAGQHENAGIIANKLLAYTKNVSIVYSDPDPEFIFELPCNLIRRPNELFWGDKFKACLDACGDDHMLVIHADCTCDDWEKIVQRCHDVATKLPIVGVWSPKIDYVKFNLVHNSIFKLKDDLIVVDRTDGIVFYLCHRIIERMRRAAYEENIYGLGIELMFVAAAYSLNMVAVIDHSVSVDHPEDTGYNSDIAQSQCVVFLKQLTIQEYAHYQLFEGYKRARKNNL